MQQQLLTFSAAVRQITDVDRAILSLKTQRRKIEDQSNMVVYRDRTVA
jgi:hypothetical protein